MDYGELVDSIISLTNRPRDKAMIELAVAKATLKCHLKDFWNRDIQEIKIVSSIVQDLSPRYELSLSSDFPKFRKMSYLRAWDPIALTAGKTFTFRAPDDSHDQYGYQRDYVYYSAGDSLTIRACGGITGLLAGFWRYPVVTQNGFTSWIAEVYPNVIIDEACVDVFGAIGDMDESRRRKDLFDANIAIVRSNDVQAGE